MAAKGKELCKYAVNEHTVFTSVFGKYYKRISDLQMALVLLSIFNAFANTLVNTFANELQISQMPANINSSFPLVDI